MEKQEVTMNLYVLSHTEVATLPLDSLSLYLTVLGVDLLMC